MKTIIARFVCVALSTLHKQCGNKSAVLNQVIDVFYSTNSIIEYSIMNNSEGSNKCVYALYAYHYRCELNFSSCFDLYH